MSTSITSTHPIKTVALNGVALLEALPHYVFIKDAQSRYISCNQAFAQLVGFEKPADIQGKKDVELPWQVPDDQAEFFLQGDQPVLHGESLKDKEGTLSLPDQAPLIVRVNKKLIDIATGHIMGILGIAEDITSEKAMETALHDALERAKIAEKTKECVLADIGHSLITPFSGIVAASDMLRKQLKEPEQLTLFRLIDDAHEALLERINQLVNYMRIQHHQQLQLSEFSTADLIEQLSSLYLPLANKKSLALLFTHDLPPRLIADHARLSSILLEIMGNAIEFTEKGQVEIALSYAQETKRLIFSVKDTGKGMPQAETQQILEPFHRLTPAYQHNTPGMGLGLSLVKSHLDAMGGQLEVNSVLGQGSCFTCSIPIDQPQHKLLIIEDNPIAQLGLKMLLKETHCAYDMAACAQDALTLLESNSYQLVISDLGLPDMDGISLVKQIKQQCPTLPIVALSAHINDKISQQCLAAGMQACYQKPLRMVQLDSILATYLVGGVV